MYNHPRDYDNSVQVPMTLHAVAVYGSLRQGLGLHHRLLYSHQIGKGTVSGAEMFDLGWLPGIVLRPDQPEKKIVVEVYAVNAQTLLGLDHIEGYYDRRVVTVKLQSGAEQKALIYALDNERAGCKSVPGGDWARYYEDQKERERTDEIVFDHDFEPDDDEDDFEPDDDDDDIHSLTDEEFNRLYG